MIGNGIRPVCVLLVEDNPADARLVSEVWRRQRLRLDLHHVASGEAALAFLDQAPPYGDAPMPDLILLDLNLPGISGQEVIEAVRKRPDWAHLPVVVLTSSDEEADIVRSYALGANAYLTKPVDLGGFRELVQSVDGFWFTVVKLPPNGRG